MSNKPKFDWIILVALLLAFAALLAFLVINL